MVKPKQQKKLSQKKQQQPQVGFKFRYLFFVTYFMFSLNNQSLVVLQFMDIRVAFVIPIWYFLTYLSIVL